MNNTITLAKLEHYFSITKQALEKAKVAFNPEQEEKAAQFFDMAQRYFNDAQYFLKQKEDAVLAFAALNYAHGWLDAGATVGFFQVTDDRLFTVDGKNGLEIKKYNY